MCAFFFLVSTNAQQLNKDQVKIAYIYNFLKHINWPEEEKKSYFVLGVYQDKKFHGLLKKSFKNKTPYYSKGFALIYDENSLKKDGLRKKLDNK